MGVFRNESAIESDAYIERITLKRAVLAGVVGGIVFGIPLQFLVERMAAVGAMYNGGTPSLAVGWSAHLAHSAVFGVILGLLTESGPLRPAMEQSLGTAALVGVGFAPAAEWAIPFTPGRPLFGHVLYGVITGTVFHALVDY